MAGPWEKYQQRAAGALTPQVTEGPPPAPGAPPAGQSAPPAGGGGVQQAEGAPGPWEKYQQAVPALAPLVPARNPQVSEGPPSAPGAPPMGQPAPQLQEGVTPTVRQDPRTLSEGVDRLQSDALATGEVALTMGAGGIAEVLGGLFGLGQLIATGDVAGATETIRRVQAAGFQPRSEEGQKLLEAVGVPFVAYERLARGAGEATLEATGSPGAATAVNTTLSAIPALAGIRTGRPGRAATRANVAGADRAAADLGVDLNAGVTAQREQLIRAGESRAAQGQFGPDGQPIVTGRGDELPDVQARVQEANVRARDAKNELFEEAKSGDASVTLDSAAGLADRLDVVRRDFLTDDMPAARRLLGEVEQLRTIQKRRDALIKKGGTPKDIAITITQLEEFGQKIRRNQPNRRADQAQFEAMEQMLKTKDKFMDDLFNADMIDGNPAVIAAWRRARKANTSYRERFSDNKVIRDLVETEAEPPTVRKWIFGASATGAKTEAAAVVRRLKDILGPNSKEFASLRHEAVLDILDPILGPEPNLKGFIREYDKLVSKNMPLARDLFGENLRGLTNLRDLAQAHRGRPTASVAELPGGARMLSVAAFGHELAKKSLLVKAGSAAATLLARTATVTPRRRLMGNMFGYDPFAPMFGGKTAAILGVTQELGGDDTLPEGVEPVDITNEASRRARGAVGGTVEFIKGR